MTQITRQLTPLTITAAHQYSCVNGLTLTSNFFWQLEQKWKTCTRISTGPCILASSVAQLNNFFDHPDTEQHCCCTRTLRTLPGYTIWGLSHHRHVAKCLQHIASSQGRNLHLDGDGDIPFSVTSTHQSISFSDWHHAHQYIASFTRTVPPTHLQNRSAHTDGTVYSHTAAGFCDFAKYFSLRLSVSKTLAFISTKIACSYEYTNIRIVSSYTNIQIS